MSVPMIAYKGSEYPRLQSEGFAAQYAFSFASKILSGRIADVGCNRMEWCYPGAEPVDPVLNEYSAYSLPSGSFDGIFTSHCYEHLERPVDALSHWHEKLCDGGVLFMYLPNMDFQRYWLPVNNRKHIHYTNPAIMKAILNDMPWSRVIVTEGYDLNGSFYVVGEK
jgi:hypothetical protein